MGLDSSWGIFGWWLYPSKQVASACAPTFEAPSSTWRGCLNSKLGSRHAVTLSPLCQLCCGIPIQLCHHRLLSTFSSIVPINKLILLSRKSHCIAPVAPRTLTGTSRPLDSTTSSNQDSNFRLQHARETREHTWPSTIYSVIAVSCASLLRLSQTWHKAKV